MHMTKFYFCFVLLCRYILISEKYWWGYNGLKPFQRQTVKLMDFKISHNLDPSISLTSFPTTAPFIYCFLDPQVL